MVIELCKILENDVGTVVKTPSLTLSLLKVYSKLYLSGAQCNTCESSLRKYYDQLKKDGMKKAIDYEKIKERTCKPSFNGLVFSPKAGHINPELLDDETATFYLLNDILKESHFEILPKSYTDNTKVKEQAFEAIPVIETESQELPKIETKKKHKK